MYHFFSAVGAGGATGGSEPLSLPDGDTASGASSSGIDANSLSTVLPIDQLREVRPDEVEQAEDDGRDDRHDDHHEGGCAHFLRRRPGDLLQLSGDFIR